MTISCNKDIPRRTVRRRLYKEIALVRRRLYKEIVLESWRCKGIYCLVRLCCRNLLPAGYVERTGFTVVSGLRLMRRSHSSNSPLNGGFQFEKLGVSAATPACNKFFRLIARGGVSKFRISPGSWYHNEIYCQKFLARQYDVADALHASFDAPTAPLSLAPWAVGLHLDWDACPGKSVCLVV